MGRSLGKIDGVNELVKITDGFVTNVDSLCISEGDLLLGCTVDDPEKYRDFYVWNDELIFERRENEKLTGFLLCPASFEEPDCSDWVEIVFDETAA